MENFTKEKEIQRGSFSTVYLVTRKADQQKYALKQTVMSSLSDTDKTRVLNEVRILAEVRHPNIIRFKECFYDSESETLNVVTEYAERGDLSRKIKSYQHQRNMMVPECQLWRILTDISKGLEYLHRHRISHRDIKPANILQTSEGYKLTDLNASKISESKNQLAWTQIGTPYYASPQTWKQQAYTQKCDIWSLGVVMYELAALKLPFPARNKNQLNNRIQKYEPMPLSEVYSELFRRLVMGMMRKEEGERPSVWAVLEHCRLYERVTEETEEQGQKENLLGTILFQEEDEQAWKRKLPMPRFTPEKTQKEGVSFKKVVSNVEKGSFAEVQNYVWRGDRNYQEDSSVERKGIINGRHIPKARAAFQPLPQQQQTPPITRKNSSYVHQNAPKQNPPVSAKDKSFSFRGSTPQKLPSINSDRNSRANLR